MKRNNKLNKVRDNLILSIKAIDDKIKNNHEPFEVKDGHIVYINDYRLARLRGIRTKCKELLRIIEGE